MVPSAWRHAGSSIKGSAVPFGQVRIRLERNSLSGNRIARAGSDPSEQPANNGEALLVCDAFKDVVTRKGNPVGSRLSSESLTP